MVSCCSSSFQNPGPLTNCITICINEAKLSLEFLNTHYKFRYNLYKNDIHQYSFYTDWRGKVTSLTLWRRNFHLNFSKPCIYNVNITGTKKDSIMK